MAISGVGVSQRKGKCDQEGYWVERGLLSSAEVKDILERFDKIHREGGVPGRYEFKADASDPLERYPRVMQPHRFMPAIREALLDPRLMDILEELGGEPQFACQSMYYFKPPQARGQAWHQDNYYLLVKPGTCLAAWIAMDPSDMGNGGLQVFQGTQNHEVVCPEAADPSTSYFGDLVSPPPAAQPVPLTLNPGDALFFNGNVIHGSMPNVSKTRFRRSLIFHYAGESCREISEFYQPMLNRRGEEVRRETPGGGGPCRKVGPYH